MRLDGRRAVGRGVVDRPVDEVLGDPAPPVATANDDADDAPHRQVVGGPDQRRAVEPRDLRSRADVAPAHGCAVEVGDDARRMLALAEGAHRPLSLVGTVAAELGDLRGAQAVGQAPAVGGPTVGVDDVGEVLEAVRGDRVGLPHGLGAHA